MGRREYSLLLLYIIITQINKPIFIVLALDLGTAKGLDLGHFCE
jgi:hypothetical protein